MPGGRCGLFPGLEKQREERRRERIKKRSETCVLRHPTNGTCLPLGENCYDCVDDKLCKAMCEAYLCGYDAAIAIVSPEPDKTQGGERRGGESSAG